MEARGTCYALFAFDVGFAIDLAKAESRVRESPQRVTLGRSRRAPPGELVSPRLRIVQTGDAISVGTWTSADTVDVTLYDFGAMCMAYRIPIAGPIESLAELSALLCDETALLDDARRRAAQLVGVLGDSIENPMLLDLVEDYGVFEIELPEGAALPDLWTREGAFVAQILRGERAALSEQEIGDALSQRLSYGTGDVALVDWSASLLVGVGLHDERAVLEFATVELLELRYLDARLDRALDEAYEAFTRRRRRWSTSFRTRRRDLARTARLQADNAILFEGVHNALKLLGDQYLARLYRSVAARFHVREWAGTIDRKLATLDSMYRKLSDEASGRRMEALEWIIIALIAVSIAVYFLPTG